MINLSVLDDAQCEYPVNILTVSRFAFHPTRRFLRKSFFDCWCNPPYFCCLNSLICPIIHVVFLNLCLVGGIPTPLKNMKVSWDDYSHIYIWKNKKWSKPPTRCKGHLPTFRTSRCSSSILGNCMAWRSPALFWGKLPRGSFWWKRKNTAKYPLVMSK